MVGGHHIRRLSNGAARARRRGADGRLHLLVLRGAVRRHHRYVSCADDRFDGAGVRAGRAVRGPTPCVLQLRRDEQGTALEDHRIDDAGLCACRRRTGSLNRAAAHDVWMVRTPAGL